MNRVFILEKYLEKLTKIVEITNFNKSIFRIFNPINQPQSNY